MTMERKIGEIFKYNGEWYQCVNAGFSCADCDIKGDCSDISIGACSSSSRTDGKKVLFKKLEKVGEPFMELNHSTGKYILLQEYKLFNSHAFLTDIVFTKHCFGLHGRNSFFIEINQITEDMETNEKTITIPDGWEFDRIDGDNIVLKKKKELPKTWHGCLRTVNETEYINDCSDIDTQTSIDEMERGGYLFGDCDRNLLPVGLAAPMLALCQLLVCRNAWWKQLGWKPDWTSTEDMKTCIISSGNKVTYTKTQLGSFILAFPTTEICDQFLETFKDLIEEAKELL